MFEPARNPIHLRALYRPVGNRIVNSSGPNLCLKDVSEYQAKDVSICIVRAQGDLNPACRGVLLSLSFSIFRIQDNSKKNYRQRLINIYKAIDGSEFEIHP